MKKLQMLLERLLEEVEREDEEAQGPQVLQQLVGNARAPASGTVPNARERLRPIVQDLQSHQAYLQAEDQLRVSEIARISRLSRRPSSPRTCLRLRPPKRLVSSPG